MQVQILIDLEELNSLGIEGLSSIDSLKYYMAQAKEVDRLREENNSLKSTLHGCGIVLQDILDSEFMNELNRAEMLRKFAKEMQEQYEQPKTD
jgi:hypothetical protein